MIPPAMKRAPRDSAQAARARAWAGVLVVVIPMAASSSAAAEDRTTALIGLVGSAALVAAGLWLENCCKTPDPPQQDDNVGLR